MRTEEEIMKQILTFASKDDRIRVVGMNGSRLNTKVKKDVYQDYDIAFLVTDMESFIKDPNWIDIFGKRIIMQTPENMTLFPPSLNSRFTYLMLFEDKNRIDLMLIPIEEKEQYFSEDSLTYILLDKDTSIKYAKVPNDKSYWTKEPQEIEYKDCWNELLWLSTYVIKGINRGELLYAMNYLNAVREMMLLLLEWQIASKNEFKTNIGQSNKFMHQFISKELYEDVLKTYPPAQKNDIYSALLLIIEISEKAGHSLEKTMGFSFPTENINLVKNYFHLL